MSGSEIACFAIPLHPLSDVATAILLPSPYAMSGTHIAYAATRMRAETLQHEKCLDFAVYGANSGACWRFRVDMMVSEASECASRRQHPEIKRKF
eukprot:737589-Rhodomonas_salina.1